MNYEIKKKESETNHQIGDLFIDQNEDLHAIVYDADRGYAILSLVDFNIASFFYDSVIELFRNANLSDFKKVYQTQEAKFEITV